MRVFRRRNAGATEGTAQDSPGALSPDAPADNKTSDNKAGDNKAGDNKAGRSPAQAAKGRPTPKRSVAEAKRRQPITGSRARAAPRTPEDKVKARANRATKYEAMKRGEAWALNPRDRGPTRALARDFVDSKRRVSEYYMYVLVVLLAAVFLRNSKAQEIISPLVLVLVVVILIDATLIRRNLTRLIAERLPGESAKGLTLYAVMRALQIRRFRVPAPRVQPGQKF